MKNRKIINQCISISLVIVYLFASSSIPSFHNHNDDHHHEHHHDFSSCESLVQYSFYHSECSHDSHITASKESCAICDYFSNCNSEILGDIITSNFKLYSLKKGQLFVSYYVLDPTNTLNKSPPFII